MQSKIEDSVWNMFFVEKSQWRSRMAERIDYVEAGRGWGCRSVGVLVPAVQ